MLYALLLSVASLLTLSLPFLHVSTYELSKVTSQNVQLFPLRMGIHLMDSLT